MMLIATVTPTAAPAHVPRLAALNTVKKSHFSTSLVKNLEAQQQRSRANETTFTSEPLSDRRSVAAKTQKERERLSDPWNEFFTLVHKIDPDSIWLRICNGEDPSWLIQDFLVAYVYNSNRERPRDGPGEYESVRGIKSASSVQSIWHTLIRAADTGILRQKRLEEPTNEPKWTLNSDVRGRGCRYSTITKINIWIEQKLPDICDLTREQTFKKKEMTDQDVIDLLLTLWTQAHHIPCTPTSRSAFHMVVLMASFGGFRPGVLLELKYRQIQFELVLDPRDSSQRRLVAWIEIKHNKQQTNTIHHSQHRILSFCVTLIPYKPLCLVSFLVARALADRAFETDFQSLDDILTRPNLETGSLPLRFKRGMEDEKIVPLTYASYSAIWSRCITVAGLRDENQRPYSLRVGAGNRLAGSVIESVRNYVLGNTEDVFLKSYQPHRISQNLVQITFGERAGTDDAHLFKNLQNSFLRRDPGAPIYLSAADMQRIEERDDITMYRHAYRETVAQTSSDSPEAKKIAAKICWIKTSCVEDTLMKARKKYFEENDRLRAMGMAPSPTSDHGVNPRKTFDPKGAAAAELIGEFMQLKLSDADNGSLDVVDLYVPYLRRCPADVSTLVGNYKASQLKEPAAPIPRPAFDPKRPHRCLFGCDSFRRRGHLTDHNTSIHFNRGGFDRPFSCPECRRLRRGEHLIDGPMQWSNHVETCHGRDHAPNLPAGLNSRPEASWMKKATPYQLTVGHEGRCLICGDIFKNAGAFTTHFRTQHVEKQKFFASPFDCPECMRQQNKPSTFDSVADWQAHILGSHQGGGVYGKLHTISPSRRQKRSLAELPGTESRGSPITVEPCPKKLKSVKEDVSRYTTAEFSPSLIDPRISGTPDGDASFDNH